MDSGSIINSVTSAFVRVHSLDVGPLSDLLDGTLGINGFGGEYTWPLGNVIIRVQVEGVRGYDKNPVALVKPDSYYHLWVPSTGYSGYLSTINRIINVIKEREINELSASLNWIRDSPVVGMSLSRAFCQELMLLPLQQVDPTNVNEAVKTTKREEIDAFSSKIIHDWHENLAPGK